MQQVMENVRKIADALTCLMFPAFSEEFQSLQDFVKTATQAYRKTFHRKTKKENQKQKKTSRKKKTYHLQEMSRLFSNLVRYRKTFHRKREKENQKQKNVTKKENVPPWRDVEVVSQPGSEVGATYRHHLTHHLYLRKCYQCPFRVLCP